MQVSHLTWAVPHADLSYPFCRQQLSDSVVTDSSLAVGVAVKDLYILADLLYKHPESSRIDQVTLAIKRWMLLVESICWQDFAPFHLVVNVNQTSQDEVSQTLWRVIDKDLLKKKGRCFPAKTRIEKVFGSLPRNSQLVIVLSSLVTKPLWSCRHRIMNITDVWLS